MGHEVPARGDDTAFRGPATAGAALRTRGRRGKGPHVRAGSSAPADAARRVGTDGPARRADTRKGRNSIDMQRIRD